MKIGTPRFVQLEAGLRHLAVVLQRGDGAVGHREDGALGERRAARRLVHREDRLDQLGLADLVLDVLARVAQADGLHDERHDMGLDVRRLRRGPVGVQLGQRVDQAREAREVGLRALAPHAREVVEDVGGHAVAGGDERVAPEDAVVARLAAGEQDLARHRGQTRLDELPAQVRRQALTVDLGAGLLEQVDGLRRVVGDAHPLEHLEGLLVDELLLRPAQVLKPRLRQSASTRRPPSRPPPSPRSGGRGPPPTLAQVAAPVMGFAARVRGLHRYRSEGPRDLRDQHAGCGRPRPTGAGRTPRQDAPRPGDESPSTPTA